MDVILNFVSNFFNSHPQIAALLLAIVVVHTAVKAFVDALVSSRAQWDATPASDDTWYEKMLTFLVRVLTVTGKAVAYIAGFRPKPKAEIIQEKK